MYAQSVELFKTSQQANQQRQLALILPNGDRYPNGGIIVSGSNEFNREQMMDILAEFPNPTYLLRPGLNVMIEVRMKSN